MIPGKAFFQKLHKPPEFYLIKEPVSGTGFFYAVSAPLIYLRLPNRST